MNRPAHTWIAARAVALLEDTGSAKGLVDLLKPHSCSATVGSWLPDMGGARPGSGFIGNHIFKIEPWSDSKDKHYITPKDKLLKRLGNYRAVSGFLKDPAYQLPASWWEVAYKGDAAPGRHIPNRAMAVCTMLKDLILMGDKEVDGIFPGTIDFTPYLVSKVRTRAEAVATYFFMLSHFVADGCVPAHCDARKMMGSSNTKGLHGKWEDRIAKIVGGYFEDANLICQGTVPKEKQTGFQVVKQSRQVPVVFKNEPVPSLGKDDKGKDNDVWMEMVNVCRASFAIASIVAPKEEFPYENTKVNVSIDDVFARPNAVPADVVDKMSLHDAVLNTAIVWQSIWNDVIQRKK